MRISMVEPTLEELMEEMREDEEQIQAHPCCANCIHCYTEYGSYLCKYEGDDVPASDEAWNPNTDVCHRWKSDITGLPRECKGE